MKWVQVLLFLTFSEALNQYVVTKKKNWLIEKVEKGARLWREKVSKVDHGGRKSYVKNSFDVTAYRCSFYFCFVLRLLETEKRRDVFSLYRLVPVPEDYTPINRGLGRR